MLSPHEEIQEQQQQEFLRAQQKYVQSTPELRILMSDFLLAVLRERPEDVLSFAASFFADRAAREAS
jgi:hypothetical protein